MGSHSIYLWIGFNTFVLAMLALDLGVFHRKSHTVSFREAISWTAVWIVLALIFNFLIFLNPGAIFAPVGESKQMALEFLAGYLIEKSLSVDNIFVFILLFSYFRVPSEYQHRVLFYGILGALVMRAILIFAGVALIKEFHWMVYIFGGFLVITGLKMIFAHGKEI
ncbi:MAG: hypothetical protein SFY68_05030, partial [Candidatus Sumerlaeia bacterium]|nr:hypothetical protein [Candidatus Sumerlaeia bacterium]